MKGEDVKPNSPTRSRKLKPNRVLAVVAALGIVVGATALPAVAAQAAPFDCLTPTIYVAQGENPDGSGATQLYSETYQLGQAVFTEIGTPWSGQTGTGGKYNAIAFNPDDRQMYGISGVYDLAGVSTYDLLQIDEDGSVNNLGPLTGMPVSSAFINAGAFLDGSYYVGSFFSTELFRVDMATRSATVVPLSQEFTVADFTPAGGSLWGTNESGNIERINPATGEVSSFSLSGVISNDDASAGAAFTFGNGNFGISSSVTGIVTQLMISDPGSATPTFSVVNQAVGPTSARNDGASCQPAVPDTDLAIEKTGQSVITPGGTITWTIRVTNNGPAISSGHTVNDTVPAGITNVESSTPGCTVTGSSLACIGSTLKVGDSSEIVLTGTAPTADGTCLVNSASVLANEPDAVPDNNENSFETCVMANPVADFTFDKIATLVDGNGNGVADAGETIAYSFDATNTGNVTLTDLKIDDPLGGSVTCDQTSLPPAATTTCATDDEYVVTATDVINGSVVNVATATATPPTGVTNPGPREDTTTTPTGDVPVAVTPPQPAATAKAPAAVESGLAHTGTAMVGALSGLAMALILGAAMCLIFARRRRQAD